MMRQEVCIYSSGKQRGSGPRMPPANAATEKCRKQARVAPLPALKHQHHQHNDEPARGVRCVKPLVSCGHKSVEWWWRRSRRTRQATSEEQRQIETGRRCRRPPGGQNESRPDRRRLEAASWRGPRLMGNGSTPFGQNGALFVAWSWSLLLLLLLVAWIGDQSESFFIDSKHSPHTSEWDYKDQARWRQLHKECSGRAQSPIDIKQRNVIISHHLRLHFFNYDKQIKFKLANAHHTIKMNPIGAAYDQDLEQPSGAGQRFNLSSSSIHEIMTADEYVEFLPSQADNSNNNNNNQRSATSGNDGDAQTQTEAAANRNNNYNKHANGNRDHSARLVGALNSTTAQQHNTGANFTSQRSGTGSHQQLDAGRRGETEKQRARDQHQMNTIELEREREHGQSASGSLFGFHLAKEQIPLYEGAPTIKLDWLDDDNNEYKLRDIHFHWAERRDNGSEHAIDGKQAAMEMHLVHIKHGLDKANIGFTSDSVAVIAILIDSHRKSNLDFNPIVNELTMINATERPREVDYKSLYDLLPNNLQAFYTYSGSLTTPPCYQVVNWIVMAERLTMNAKQIEIFRNLYAPPPKHHNSHLMASLDDSSGAHDDTNGDGAPHPITPNVRRLQMLNNRTIMASFTKHGSRLESVTYSFNSVDASHPVSSCLVISCLLCSLLLSSLSSSVWRLADAG